MQLVRRAADLVDKHHRLSSGPIWNLVVKYVQRIIVRTLNDKDSAHAVLHVNVRRSVLVSVIPMSSGRLTHLQTGWWRKGLSRVLRQLKAVGIGADIILRPPSRVQRQFVHSP